MRKISLLTILALSTLRAQDVDLLWGVKIPTRDGVHLNATVFKPKTTPAPLPVETMTAIRQSNSAFGMTALNWKMIGERNG